jgi:Fe2+ transport system protein FeoA
MQTLETFEVSRCNERCPLSRVKAGVTVRIKQICAAPAVAQRLREIGFCEEQMVRLVNAHTNIICQVCNARLALSAELAEIIFVEPVVRMFRSECQK